MTQMIEDTLTIVHLDFEYAPPCEVTTNSRQSQMKNRPDAGTFFRSINRSENF